MSTCLVTGGAGFLGSHLCDELLARGNRVICVDNLETGSLANIEHIRDPERFEFLHIDITAPYFVEEPVDFVYHFASPASPIDYLRLPLHTLKVGSYGTHHTLGLAKAKRARFLTASTSEVYGDPLEHPQSESYWGHVNPIGPRGVYDEAKRYAEALTMAYHRQQGVDTSIVRIFNSILADEQVLYDDGTELRREPVEQAAARLLPYAFAAGYVPRRLPRGAGSTATALRPALEYPLDGYTVPAFESGGRQVAASATHLIAHPTDARCFEVRTRYGRSIRVTGDHSIFVEGPDGQPVAQPVEELEPGDRVAIARRIEVPERDRESVSMLDVWCRAEADQWDLTVEAEGLGELAWAHRHELFGLLVSMRRNKGPNWRNGAWTKLIRMRRTNRVPLPIVRRLLTQLPVGARVRQAHAGRSISLPATIEITDALLWLLGLWVAEGSWHESSKGAFLTISCEEAVLARAREVMERELGLHVVCAPASPERAAAIFVHSKLLLRLMDHLGFEGNRKRIPGWVLGLPLSRLKWFLEGYREGDGVHSGQRLREGIRHAFVTTSDELKDDLIVAFARFGLVPSVGRYSSRISKKTGDREYPFWTVTLGNVSPWSPLDWDAGVTQKLNARVTGDLVWAKVTGIEEIDATPLVYDFSVPGLENFWAGTGVMAKNTYGARMRPHDGRAIPTFLRQALANRPITVFGNGSQTRSFCYVSDLIRGIIALAESGHHYPVNIGNPDEFTLLELAEIVKELTGSTAEIVYEALPEDDPKQRKPNIELAGELLGWSPEVPLREGLRRTIEQSGVELLIGGGAS
ncbi:MAG TPA: NAD-dependent epimerase/dehydratase family protein [Solirubrobacteraceae bacterium]|jgi:UDP-glucuronate decarboxylase|nr:NAD-dependent epimerase/dehydratase family protein [Solirubrobacteraceae bacterium]